MTVPARNVVVRRTAATRTPRTPLVAIDQLFHSFLFNWGQAKDAGTQRDKDRDRIKKWFDGGGDADHEITVNENGSPAVEFDKPLTIGGRTFRGLENRRTVTTGIDPDLVDEWLEDLPQAEREKLAKRLYKREVVFTFQPDVLFALNQEGVIDDKTMDSFTAVDVKYALNVLLA